MADIIATLRVMRSARDQIAADRARLRLLSVKVSETLLTLQRANIAYRDSLRLISPVQPAQRLAEPDPLDLNEGLVDRDSGGGDLLSSATDEAGRLGTAGRSQK
jgi:hypothetical protein